MPSPGAAVRPAPPVSCGGPPARESGPWQPQPVDSPRSPQVLSAEAGCQLFGLGWKVSNGVGDSGPLNVDYLVRLSRTQKTHDLVSIRGLIHSTERSGRSSGGKFPCNSGEEFELTPHPHPSASLSGGLEVLGRKFSSCG